MYSLKLLEKEFHYIGNSLIQLLDNREQNSISEVAGAERKAS
jgi:hypothetical protein